MIPAQTRPAWRPCVSCWAAGWSVRLARDWIWVFVGSTLLVAAGVALGQAFFPPVGQGARAGDEFVDGFVRWDAYYYRDIVTDGYVYRPGQAPLHFPPGYPLMARAVRAATGLSVGWAMVLTSHACLLAALALLADYAGRRHGGSVRTGTLLAVAALPFGVFFHFAYAESPFLLICVGLLWLMDRGYHPVVVAAVAALAPVTRFVGIGLLPAALWYAWRYGRGGWWAAVCLPVALTGVAALMAFFDHTFGDPILFARGRDDLWRISEALPLGEKCLTLLTLEPIWAVFDPASPAYWGAYCRSPTDAVFSIYPANPIVFLAALGLTAWGAWAGRLNEYELIATLGLLGVPYWVGGYDMNMVSMARYVSVVVPLYLVGGGLLARVGTIGRAGFAAAGGVLTVVYAARFAQGHWII